MRSGPGEARTILLFHTISARPPKQPRMVRTFLKAYMELGSYFLFLALVRLLKIIVLYWKTSPVCHCRMGNTTDDCDKRPHQLTSVVHKRNRGTQQLACQTEEAIKLRPLGNRTRVCLMIQYLL